MGWDWAATAIAPYGTAFGPWAVVPELRGNTDGGVHVALASLSSAEETAYEEKFADLIGA